MMTPETAAGLARLRAEHLTVLAGLLTPHTAECPEHGNTLVRDAGVTVCCIKNCPYQVPS